MRLVLLPFIFLIIQSSGFAQDSTGDTCTIEVDNRIHFCGDDFLRAYHLNFISNCEIENFHLFIFNRWGEVLFESNDINDRWDGTFDNKLVIDGRYVWKITGNYVTSESIERIGYFDVIR